MANVPESKNDRGGHWDNTQDQIARLAADDGVSQWEVQANNLYGWDSAGATWRRVKVDATGTLVGGVSGGGPATIADGADVAQGTTSDVAWVSGSGTVISLLKKIASAGGSAVSIADGADVAQGTTTDLSSANTVIGILKAIKAAITGTVAVSAASLPLPTNAATETTLALQQVSTGTAIGSLKHQVAGAQANASAPTWTEATFSPLSQTLAGALRISGTVTATQGTPNSAANKWPISVTDGTNTATVKAASTAAAATDTALVVAISPNNTVPVTLTSTTITGTVDVSDRAGRLLGIVDKGKVWDGTNIQAVKAASTAAVAADPAAVVALSPNNNILANALFTKPGDGTNTITVKAASTTPVAGDTGLVASISPNSNPVKVWDGSNTMAVKAASVPAAVTDPAAVVAISSWSTTKVLSAASTNANFSKASAGLVGGWYIYNAAASARFVRLYNKASAPTVGTDSPAMVIAIPAGAAANVEFTAGLVFNTGIAYAITGAIADLDATAVAASDVLMNLYWK